MREDRRAAAETSFMKAEALEVSAKERINVQRKRST